MWSLPRCVLFGGGVILAAAFSACSSSSGTPPPASMDASSVDAASDAHTDGASDAAHEASAFHGDCKASKWASSLSDACWSCFCAKCERPLDLCGPDCLAGIKCATDNHVIVGAFADLGCEMRGYVATCGPVIPSLYSFDGCLIGAYDSTKEMLRACEAECGTTYTGDVCQRFPAPDGGDGG